MTTEKQSMEPVRKSVTVNASVDHAFLVFTERMGDWWPIKTHSVHEVDAVSAGMEPRQGGAIFEVWHEGREVWGEITAWDPPHRLVFTWHPGVPLDETTEVEVRFASRGNVTVVELEHRGWETRGERAEEVRSNYESGWVKTLDRFAAAV
ncbi:MAG TPA: SRPBCC domain-containing protein [Acidimicrobiia bacterium]|nr:SRPBCC domain-containing protein [Acidimicrobiia bacterium]